MTLTLLDLYNATASQEWAMYDNDAASEADFEPALVLAINKTVRKLYTSYNFPFMERVHIILTIPRIEGYTLPQGLIKTDSSGQPVIKYNSNLLKPVKEAHYLEHKCGIPDSFFIKNDSLILYPTPMVKGIVTIEYYTIAIGENAQGEDIYSLEKATDSLNVPTYLEALMKDAIITGTVLNTIASESDENYSAYKKQAESAFLRLIKYSKGVKLDKSILF